MFEPGPIEFASDPEGARVQVDNGQRCTTPCKLVIRPVVKQTVRVTKEGLKPAETLLRRRYSGPFYFNLIFGPFVVVGIAVDWLTDSMWTYKGKPYHFYKLASVHDEEESEEVGVRKAPPPKAKKPKKAPDEAPKELEAPEPVAEPDEREEPLPETVEVARMRETHKESSLDVQVTYYYGGLTPEARARVRNRLYRYLLEMQANGEAPNIDEAVRRDRFDQLERKRRAKP